MKTTSLTTPIVSLLVLGTVVGGGLALWSQRAMITLPNQDTNSITQTGNALSHWLNPPTPTPFPFAELTIPTLRQRSYQSQLGEQRRVSQNATYTTSLTSYDSDGLRINALLTQPTGTPPEGGWPAVVFIHGYIPPTLYRTQEKYVEYVNFLARNGFVVLKIDLRGHGDSEGDPGGAYYSSDYVIDTLNAYRALQASDFVNPQRIGLWGHSMAGNVVLRSLAVMPDIPAGVIWAGAGFTYSDLQDFGIDDNSYRPPSQDSARQEKRRQLFEAHGTFTPDDPFWSTVTPSTYLGELNGAVQLHHAVNDDVVSVEYSRNLNRLLQETGVEHEFHEYTSGGHNLNNPSFTPAMQRTVEFLEKWLQ